MGAKVGRNQRCPCGSGLKSKKCCGSPLREGPPVDVRRPPKIDRKFSRKQDAQHDDYVRCRSELENLFTCYNAGDTYLALGVSDLWLPNISSQIKHYFALTILGAIPPDRFISNTRLDTYASFRIFIERLYALLPNFPTLEDYVPEMDWGEVKILSQGKILRLFYGSAVERIPDFVEAFKIKNARRPAALDDMHLALSFQNHIISSIDREIIGKSESVSSGHIEFPEETFWEQCRGTLLSISEIFPTDKALSSELIVEQGSCQLAATFSEFSDAIMTGTTLPAILLRLDGALYPLAVRNALGAVVDYWDHHTNDSDKLVDSGTTQHLAEFLQQRIDSSRFSAGPFSLQTRTRRLPHKFAAAIVEENSFYFVIAINKDNLSILPTIESDIRNMMSGSEEWVLRPEGGHRAFQFRNEDGRSPQADEITIVAVIPQVSTANGAIPLPETKARVLFLSEFVTLFDSIEDISELRKFFVYLENSSNTIFPGFIGVIDRFAAFRASHGVLITGAITPDMISLDPHWGSNWRYSQLVEFWRNAPALLPNDTSTAWRIGPLSDGVQELLSKGEPSLSWSTTVNGCVLYFAFHMRETGLDLINGRMLEQLVHCLADSTYQRKEIIENLTLFEKSRLTTIFCANKAAYATEDSNGEEILSIPLFSGWQLYRHPNSASITASVFVNLARVMDSLTDPIDNRFEAECVVEWVNGLQSLLSETPDAQILTRLNQTSSRRPRFTVTKKRRMVDVPDFASPEVPEPEQYKLARRNLAILLKEQGATPGRYEFTAAKSIIDPARDAFRAQIHSRIAALDRPSLLVFCVQQHDALVTEYKRKLSGVKYSFNHEVSYDRSQALAEAYEKYLTEGRNYRYLLECCLSMPSSGTTLATTEIVMDLVANIDWLFVLYNASDVLHNGLEVAGIDLDDMFVPEIFYSSKRTEQEKAFSLERAGFDLGINIDTEENVISLDEFNALKKGVDQAFLSDAGFSFTHFTQTLSALTRWQSIQGKQDYHLSYQVAPTELSEVLRKSIDGLTKDEASSLIAFATLKPEHIRRLLGKPLDESDVPVWDHTKRGDRYAIKPLIPLVDGSLIWGAAAAERAFTIWTTSIANGYLPADFPWPNVQEVVRTIKAGLEKQLETRSFEVCGKFARYVMSGIDFKFRFPRKTFDDVGDFDVLAYWPESNHWLVVECKYNQPPFCLKDARRLRDRIFGPPERGHFTKIERRRNFLTSNSDLLRRLLDWPIPAHGLDATVCEVYVSREIYWWMRNPPFEIPTHFARIDALDGWLQSKGYRHIIN